MIQQPLIRRGAAATADRAGPPTEGNPWVGGGVLLRLVLVLMVVMMVMVCSQKGLLILTKPGDSPVCRLLTRRLLRNHSRTVNVVVLHMRGPYLVDGIDGEGMLQAAIWHSTV